MRLALRGAALGTLLAVTLGSAALVGAATFPTGFSQEVVATGLDQPTAIAFFPDGRIAIAQKQGVVRLVKNGSLLTNPLINLSSRVNDYWDRGLIGIAVDPDFTNNPYVYLLYVYENDPIDYQGPKTSLLTRVTVTGDTASLASEVIIVGTSFGTTTTRQCSDHPAGADCIPADNASHTVGNIKFASDGTLFFTSGDASDFNTTDPDALRAQDLDSLAGKVLHVTRAGQGVPTNPFWTGDPNANRSKVWAYGVRNPYRFNLRPSSGIPYLGDVGSGYWEEVDVGRAGANFGWPCYEGNGHQPGYSGFAECQALYAAPPGTVTPPLVTDDHNGGSACRTGGVFYTGNVYPASYQGLYFYADFSQDWFRTLQVDSNDALVAGSVTDFAASTDGPVDVEMGPDGLIYYVAISANEVRRIRYTVGNTPPTAVASANPTAGLAPLTVQFSSAGSLDPDNDPLTFQWDFGDGTGASGATLQHTYQLPNGTKFATLTVTDSKGATATATVPITVGNRPPVASITSPSSTFTYKVGDVINYAGSATDPDQGTLAASALSWRIVTRHCPGGACHTHTLQPGSGAGGSFTVPDHGDDSYLEFILTATDAGGLTSTTSLSIMPKTVQITLASNPTGLQVIYDGSIGAAPLTRTTIVGSLHTLNTQSPQGGNTFASWSDGGAMSHQVTIGTSNVTYTVNFTSGVTSCPVGQYLAEYFNNQTLTAPSTFTRCETPPLNNNWGAGGPGGGVGVDNFSVRWTGTFAFAAGSTTFTTTSDDGVRLWVDNVQVINNWTDHAPTTNTWTQTLTAGNHDVKIEFHEAGVGAVLQASWVTTGGGGPTSCPVGQYLAEYFNNQTLTAPSTFTRCETPPLNNNWGAGGPGGGVGVDNFSVRWTGTFAFAAGSTTFTTTSDDGVRLWVDNVQVINNWTDHAPTTNTWTQTLTAGNHDVKIEFYEVGGGAVLQASWVTTGGGGPTSCPVGQYLAEYFNNQTLTAPSTFTRCETPPLNNNWGAGGPGSGVGVDNFSVRWTGTFAFAAGSTTFTTTSDDGVRLWVDNVQVINNWTDHAPTTNTWTQTLTAGNHDVKIEFHEAGGGAVLQASWVTTGGGGPTSCPVGQYLAEYFANRTLSGAPVFTRCETSINYDWGSGGPGNGIPTNNFSVRWVGRFSFVAGSRTFTTRSDDGVRLWVDGVRVINFWTDHLATTRTVTRTMTAGEHEIRVEYYERTGPAVIQVSW